MADPRAHDGFNDSREKWSMAMHRYEIRLPYSRSDTLAAAFPEMEAMQLTPATTMLIGILQDQSELHGILARIADMGLEITEVRQDPA